MWAGRTGLVGVAMYGAIVIGASDCRKRTYAAPESMAAASSAASDDLASPGPSAVKTASGLSTKVLRMGSGQEHPVDSDRVRVHYTGWTADGTMFDSSLPGGEPAVFTLTQMIAGWSEALKLMVTGEKRWI